MLFNSQLNFANSLYGLLTFTLQFNSSAKFVEEMAQNPIMVEVAATHANHSLDSQ